MQQEQQENSAEKISKVISAVCSAFNISPKDITNKEDRAFLVPRQAAAYFLKKAGQTLKTIRQTLCLVVDGQVYQYCARVKQLTSTDATVRETVEKIAAELGHAQDNSPSVPAEPTSIPTLVVPKIEKRGRPKKSEQVAQRIPALMKVFKAQHFVIFVLWKECGLSPKKIANLFALTEEQVYTALGKAAVSLESKDGPFGQALALVQKL